MGHLCWLWWKKRKTPGRFKDASEEEEVAAGREAREWDRGRDGRRETGDDAKGGGKSRGVGEREHFFFFFFFFFFFVHAEDANETRVFIRPLAKKTALEKGVDYAKIRGRGPNGRVTNLDVLEFVASGGAANVKSSAQQQQQSSGAEFDASIYFPEYEEVPISTIKKITAKRLTESKQTVPHFYLTVDVNMDAVNATRARMNALLEKEKNGKKIGVNDFVVKASAAALRQCQKSTRAGWTRT